MCSVSVQKTTDSSSSSKAALKSWPRPVNASEFSMQGAAAYKREEQAGMVAQEGLVVA
jgi:hypothetical protein